MNSTTWFWSTIVMGMLASVSGRSSVGPNTMAMLCTDMRFCSPCSTTLRGKDNQAWGRGHGDPSLGAESPCSPVQVLEQQLQGVMVWGGQ